MIPDTAELLHWLSAEEEDDEQGDLNSHLFLPIDSLGPELEEPDADLSEALSNLTTTKVFASWTH